MIVGLVFCFFAATGQELSMPLAKMELTSRFGYRIHPLNAKRHFHSGIDLRAYYEPVRAILSGRVSAVGQNPILGKYLRIDHGNFRSVYGHLSAQMLKQGSEVSAGEFIAISGNSGQSTGPHLHLSIIKNQQFINPLELLIMLQYLPKTKMKNRQSLSDNLPLSQLLLLMELKDKLSLSAEQAQQYGTEQADQHPDLEEEEDGK